MWTLIIGFSTLLVNGYKTNLTVGTKNRIPIIRFVLFLSYFFLINLSVYAQSDTLSLPTIDLQASGVSGEQQDLLDSTILNNYTAQHLGQLLSVQSGVFVRNYGLGSSATTSIRGGSAEHTRVLWNGLPLENPMLGQFDFSLLPAIFVDEVRVHQGGNTAAWGNGAIGGTVQLDNQTSWQQDGFKLKYSTVLGDFGLLSQGVKANFGTKKIIFTSRLFYTRSDNDFSYEIREDLPKRTQTNAYFRQAGVLQEVHWRPHPQQELNVYAWWQDTERQLPPTTVQNRSVAYQLDDTKRLSADWKLIDDKTVFSAKAAWFDEKLHYVDSIIGFDDKSGFDTYLGEFKLQHQLTDNQTVELAVQNNYQTAFAEFYEEQKSQNRLAILNSWKGQFDFLRLDVSVRQEWQDDQRLPIVAGLGMEIDAAGFLKFHGRFGRHYRSPNLNALYYQPSGNPDLLPENGWSQEAGFSLSNHNSDHHTRFSATAFHRLIDNWIRWAFNDNGQVMPLNIAQVKSRGMEYRLRYKKIHSKNFQASIDLGYQFTQSLHQQDIPALSIRKGDQEIYTPEHLFFSNFIFQYRDFSLSYQHHFTGTVITPNLTILDNYQIGNAQLSYHLKTGVYLHRISLAINNIWDTNYRVIERRPMPGRNVELRVVGWPWE